MLHAMSWTFGGLFCEGMSKSSGRLLVMRVSVANRSCSLQQILLPTRVGYFIFTGCLR